MKSTAVGEFALRFGILENDGIMIKGQRVAVYQADRTEYARPAGRARSSSARYTDEMAKPDQRSLHLKKLIGTILNVPPMLLLATIFQIVATQEIDETSLGMLLASVVLTPLVSVYLVFQLAKMPIEKGENRLVSHIFLLFVPVIFIPYTSHRIYFRSPQ